MAWYQPIRRGLRLSIYGQPPRRAICNWKSVQVHADSINHALDLVSSGRVDATTVLCQFNDQPVQPAELQQRPVLFHPQPVHRSVGYLMLSNAFFKAQPDVAQNLWQQVANTRSTERYLEYLQQQNP